ncbi:hypothetical protein ACQEU5_18560 [Marinactinospora thermotolerans]|uniref:hypothetical protein n=1 Tax=Marinactinospora thermotolerans TaxID=531310 RepID=UPI0011847E05|nr:hypothetical protein [Marinactinospora thermotolerans]
MAVALIFGLQGVARAAETSASITCDDSKKTLYVNASGVDYPGNINVEVVREIFDNGKLRSSHETTVRTSSTGSWSVPRIEGTYKDTISKKELKVRVYNAGGRELGRASDRCADFKDGEFDFRETAAA